jgi:LysM repeat protein
MQITHEEAHKLIQFNVDEALDAQQKSTLFAHLKDCIECRAYAEGIQEIESILLPVMKRRWNISPIPLSIQAILARKTSRAQANIILATRTAAIGVVFLALMFSAWQFALSGGQVSSPLPVGSILPVPTPSAQSTSTKSMSPNNCGEVRYVVRESDTLESIAHRFLVSKEVIVVANRLKTEAIHPAMELIIPICGSTPVGTVTLFSTTYTPSISPVASTPSG